MIRQANGFTQRFIMNKEAIKMNKEAIKKIKSLDKKIEKKRGELCELYEQRREIENQLVDLKGKYVKYSYFKNEEPRKFLLVNETFKHGTQFIVRGHGFEFNYSPYADNNYANFDAFMTIELENDDAGKLEEQLNNFIVITKEEYLLELKEMTDFLFKNVVEFINSREEEKENAK